jgi:hypothetical protein
MVDLKRIDFSPETGGSRANSDLVICRTRYPAADGLRRCVLGFRILQVRYWHKADMLNAPTIVRF